MSSGLRRDIAASNRQIINSQIKSGFISKIESAQIIK